VNNIFRAIAVALVLFVQSSLSFACGKDEYEQCWRVDLGPLGEAKDCKCLPKVGGTVAETFDKNVKPTVAAIVEETRKSPQAVSDCLANVGTCVRDVIASPFSAAAQLYIDNLYKQSSGRTESLAQQFIALAQPYYSVNLNGITTARGINTGHGQTVAYCDRIFFAPSTLNIWGNYSDLHLLLHELEHTVQCQGRGRQTYLAEYLLKGGMDIIKRGQVNVHDMHDYEVAADAKANRLTPILWNQIQQSTAANGGGSVGGSGTGGTTGTGYPPQQYLNFCQTQAGTCQMPPYLGYRGAQCYCQTYYGIFPGQAY
jgi:hypothetical protein